MATKYKVNWNLDFGKKQYREGTEIRESDIPADQVDVLLKCGVISPIGPDDSQEQVGADAAATLGKLAAEEIAKLTKANLADMAKYQFDTELDPAAMTKDAMLAAIAELASKKAAAAEAA